MSGIDDKVKQILHLDSNKEKKTKQAWPQVSKILENDKETKSKNVWSRRNTNYRNRKPIQWNYRIKFPKSKER
jgi:hypothetical protein